MSVQHEANKAQRGQREPDVDAVVVVCVVCVCVCLLT